MRRQGLGAQNRPIQEAIAGVARLLQLDNVVKTFGALRAVDGVSLQVRKAMITGLIGPNGAGKTTLFNTIAGAYVPDGGSVVWRPLAEVGGGIWNDAALLQKLNDVLLEFYKTDVTGKDFNLRYRTTDETFAEHVRKANFDSDEAGRQLKVNAVPDVFKKF